MADRTSVKIINAALDEWDGDIVLRGTIDPASLGLLQIADYQREVLSSKKIERLKDALRTSRVPDVELNCRIMDYRERGNAFYLPCNVFVVDGQQRITAGTRLMEEEPPVLPHIGALIHFGHDEEWERNRFSVLNLGQTKISPNVTLRNLRYTHPVADALYSLCKDDLKFVMHDKVSFSQGMRVGELITALTFWSSVGMLHSHIGPGRNKGPVPLTEGLQKIMDTTGRNTLVNNVKFFFDTIDASFGLTAVYYRNEAVHLKVSFLLALARMFSDHTNFWNGDRLQVDIGYIKKLSTFPLADPTVRILTSSSGMAVDQLSHMLAEHLSKNRRTTRQTPRNYIEPAYPAVDGGDV